VHVREAVFLRFVQKDPEHVVFLRFGDLVVHIAHHDHIVIGEVFHDILVQHLAGQAAAAFLVPRVGFVDIVVAISLQVVVYHFEVPALKVEIQDIGRTGKWIGLALVDGINVIYPDHPGIVKISQAVAAGSVIDMGGVVRYQVGEFVKSGAVHDFLEGDYISPHLGNDLGYGLDAGLVEGEGAEVPSDNFQGLVGAETQDALVIAGHQRGVGPATEKGYRSQQGQQGVSK